MLLGLLLGSAQCFFVIDQWPLQCVNYSLEFFTTWLWKYFVNSCNGSSLRYLNFGPVGGMVLHKGEIAEMRTGEGKTLVAILPAYLNALSGKGVHVVTVNDYLARRDCEWVGQVPRFLGLKVGLIQRRSCSLLV